MIEACHKKTTNYRIHLYGNVQNSERLRGRKEITGCSGLEEVGKGELGVTTRDSFWGDENVLELLVMVP